MATSLLRLATPEDAPRLLEVYAPYVEHTVISFEDAIPSPEEYYERVERITSRFPYLLLEVDGEVLGYAYASTFRERIAYRYDVETSIYLHRSLHGRRVGGALYQTLLNLLAECGYYTAVAGIAVPHPASVRLHESLGFVSIGTLEKIGYKLGKWVDVLWMQKRLREYTESPAPAIPVVDLPEAIVQQHLQQGAAAIGRMLELRPL